MIPKDDQVRAHVLKNLHVFGKADLETVQALYPPEAEFRKLIDRDNERFLKALTAAGAVGGDPESVSTVTLHYEATLELAAAAAEVGLAPAEYAKRLSGSVTLSRVLGPLNAKGGTVQRQVFIDAFPELVRKTPAGRGYPGRGSGHGADQQLHTLRRPQRLRPGHRLLGRRRAGHQRRRRPDAASVGGRDGQGAARFEGRTGEITSVAFARDGDRAVSSGSHDRTVRLWDVATGKELRR